MNVIPLAADSLGVRSVATYVECGDTRIVIDPGASLGRSRFNLPPADAEWEALKRANDRISAYATRATTIFVSHYHEDHFRYDPGIYRDKTVWAKDPKRMLGGTQGERAAKLWKGLAGGCRLDAAEGRRMETLDAILAASSPLSHGPGRHRPRLRDRADGDGPSRGVPLRPRLRRAGPAVAGGDGVSHPRAAQSPHLSGPPAYLERELGSAVIDRGVANLSRVIDATGCRVIMDHHAVRDARYPERFRALWESGRVVTAAEFLGLADAALESSAPRSLGASAKPPGRVASAPAERAGRGARRRGRSAARRPAPTPEDGGRPARNDRRPPRRSPARGMTDYLLERRFWLPRPRAEVFDFFADPTNLALVQPPGAHLRWMAEPPAGPRRARCSTSECACSDGPTRWRVMVREFDRPIASSTCRSSGPFARGSTGTGSSRARARGRPTPPGRGWRTASPTDCGSARSASSRTRSARAGRSRGLFDYRERRLRELLS